MLRGGLTGFTFQGHTGRALGNRLKQPFGGRRRQRMCLNRHYPHYSAVAEGLAVAPCQVRQDEVEIWVQNVQDRVVAWLVEHSGIEVRDTALSPETREWLKSIDRLPIEKQVSIIEHDRARLRTC